MPDSAAPSAAPSRRPSLPSSRPSAHPSRRPSTTGAASSPTHASQQATPALSRKSSTSTSAPSQATTSTTTATPARSRAHSVSKSAATATTTKPVYLPPYVHFINSYTPLQPTSQSSPSSSPFHSSTLYTLTPHETTLLFQHYTTAAASATKASPTASHSLGRDEFAALVLDWLQQLRRRGVESATAGEHGGVVLDGVNGVIDGLIASSAELAGQLFTMLDTNCNERIERDEFKLFLASVDSVVGARIRAEWKKAVIVPRLKALAGL